ncbi:hypothetical protein [Paraburkholderia nemoris]|uniref:hypothetical protein n=1 Tax=Paraburkholderia nemoris TaxID=2793076 RepID=UPI001B2C756E|nr:hypothetical protein [Paraburkholderia nemoris]CAE6724666.1 hypothetical protein LMG22931_01899 [Paraburkholderia nemoris]
MAKIATPRQVQVAFNRMIDQLEANLAARKAAEAQKTEPAVEKGDEQAVGACDGSAGEASA